MAKAEIRSVRPEGSKVWFQAKLNRDLHFIFKDFCTAHQLTHAEGLDWAVRALLNNAGIDLRHVRREKPEAQEVGTAE